MLIIARHGRTVANATGLLQGRVDNPLDELGVRQAEAIAAAVGVPDRLISSSLLRAVQTAAAFGIEPEIDDRWIELDYGDWDERPVGDVAATEWASWRADPEFAPPNGESLAELNARVTAASADLLADARDQLVVVVCHVSPIKAAMRWALGVEDEVSWRLHVAQASISRIVIRGDRPVLTSFNEGHHLAHL
ncbi:MAG: histidine phosphatase family protein [Acidimicrobiales bacterium]|jgi:probable phosphoglycerate mutase